MGIQYRQALPISVPVPVREAPQVFDYTVEMCLTGDGWAGIQVGVAQGRGYALMANVQEQCVHFMEIKGGAVLIDRGMKRLPLEKNVWYPLRALYDGRVLRMWLNENCMDEDPWPKFEFELELPGRGVGTDDGGCASFRHETLNPVPAGELPVETFTNPVLTGADPDILFYDGRYYIYNRIPNDPSSREDAYLYNGSERAGLDQAGDANAIFRAAWSEDLVHWSSYSPVLYRDEALTGAFCMSPNVFEKDGWFYLLFAAGRFRGEENFHVYYATSRSPMGPFCFQRALHPGQEEIGGMPFVDTDGQVYITYVRFDRGNHIFLQRLTVENGVITPQDDTLVRVLSPEKDYEVDAYGRIVEGGVIIPHKGWYYMIYADGHYLGHYGESYAVADNVFGPYRRYEHNPILHHHFQADGTGDGIVIYSPDRSQMYMGYHRHVSTSEVEPRMTCLDPMKFVPDPRGGPDILTVRGPSTVPQQIPFAKTNQKEEDANHEFSVDC